LTELPQTIAEMQNLVVLDVKQNLITILPPMFDFPRLECFVAAANSISRLPDSMKGCAVLEILDLGENPVEDDFFTFALHFPKLRMLKPEP
jgi:Leucine-rich repeat (LRR) protein